MGSFKVGWISILHPDFTQESINTIALEISEDISAPILAIGYYDDDFFTLAVIRDGHIITEHVSGCNLESYGLEPIDSNAEIIINELELDVASEVLDDVFNNKDIEKKVKDFEKLIRLPIWIKADWIDDIEESDESRSKWNELMF